jgi:shikimate kinase
MGAGKTSIGKLLARRLKRPFHDSDRELERRTGVDIPTIFEYEGEAGFRARESAVIDDLTRLQGIVLATGGGAVLKAQNRKRLTARGLVVYLRAGVDTQLRRTARDRNRPLLQTEDPRARLEALLRMREPLYLETADLVIDTERSAILVIVNRIVRQYRELSPHG